MLDYDVIVLGAGGMGSASLYHLACRGMRVLALEQYDIPNEMGSSHGVTRIIRQAYYEDPSYVPLLSRSYQLWRELEAASGESLIITTGSIDAGPEGSLVFEGSRYSCQLHNLCHEVLESRDVTARFPGYHIPSDSLAVLQPDGGFLLPERCIVAHVEGALEKGAEVHGREQVLSWEHNGEGVEVRTGNGTYSARRLVVCAGAWTGKLLPQLCPLAVPERQVLAWLQPSRPELFQPDTFPVFNILVDEGKYYGLPIYGIPGFKVGRFHHLKQYGDPDTMDREIRAEDEEVLRSFTSRYFPDAAGPVLSMKTCIFTNSPDEHFILDFHPEHPQVCIAAGFSGHGFKFCSVVGEIMADLVEHGHTDHNIDLLRLDRFKRELA